MTAMCIWIAIEMQMQRLCLRHNHSVLEEAYLLISSSKMLREVLLGDWLRGTTVTSTLVLRDEDVLVGLQLLAFLCNIRTFDKPCGTSFHPASVNLPNARHGGQFSGSQDQVTPGLGLFFSDRSSLSSVDKIQGPSNGAEVTTIHLQGGVRLTKY